MKATTLPALFLKRLLGVLMFLLALHATAQTPDEIYLRGQYVGADGDTLNYRLLVPESIEPGQQYPLILFMHGAGERGNDNQRQLIHGAQLWLNPVNRLQYPAYVLLPQCPEDKYWSYSQRPESFIPSEMPIEDSPTPIVSTVMQLLAQIVDANAVDASRIYVMGLSMGGMATYDLAVRYPETFAAAVPICGTVNPDRLAAARDVKFRIYHGDADPIVTVDGSRHAYRRLRQLGADVTYVEFPGVAHGSWYPAFADPQFLPWLFGQSK